MRTSRAAAVVAVVALAWTPVPAHAQSAQDQAAAEGLFTQARDLMAAGKIAEACPKFAESQRLDPSAGTLLNLATCYEREGKIASAWVTFKEAATAAQRAEEPQRVKLAKDRVDDLAPKLPTLAVVVPAASEVPGLVVRRDGEDVGRAVWGAPIPVDPGVHPVTASAPGYVEWKGQVQVEGPGAKASVEIPPLVLAPKAPPPPPPPPPPPTGTAQRVLGVVMGSVGLAGIATGSVFGFLAKSHLNDSSGHCTGSVCDSTGDSALSDARSSATVSTVGFIAGGVLLAGGLAIYFTAPRGDSPRVGLEARPSGFAVSGEF